MPAASSAEALRTERSSWPPAAAACSWPNAPKSTFVNERFIAFDMFTERMNPEAPSSAPATISSLLSIANPIAAAESPAYEFSSEITVGMSAPPIGMIIITPNASEIRMMAGKSVGCAGFQTRMPAAMTARASSPRLTMFCPL